HALAAEEHLHRGRREARPNAVADQRMRDAVVVAIDVNVVVEGDATLLPLRERVGLCGKGLHRRPIECLEDTATAARQALEGSSVELLDQRSDRSVEFVQAEELLVPQPRQHPAAYQ